LRNEAFIRENINAYKSLEERYKRNLWEDKTEDESIILKRIR
jgi:hypothetical protein